MKLIIAEKPSVAKSLAAVLGANARHDGYMQGGGYIVSWCYGHLVELARPAVYGEQYRRWAYDTLPILPKTWRYEASGDKKQQLDTLRSLMGHKDVASIVNACDAGREGELIFRLVYEYCGCKKAVQRLWISSMEDAAIREGFEKLRDGAGYDNLYSAALCRSQADWVAGINGTRLFSILYESTLNVGRVQSPTLAMIVSREAAVRDFTPEPFYIPLIDTGNFAASGERLKTPEDAESVRQACDGQDAAVLSVEKKQKTEAQPKLYDLTSLQRDANRLLGYTAQQTLDYAQALYEKKLATYPRTDSRYLTTDMAEGLANLVNMAAMRLPFARVPVPVDPALVVDDAKVSDHHAILPTITVHSLDWNTLPTGERNILTLLIVRLTCAVGEAHSFEAVTAVLECAGTRFTAKGKTVLHEGWKAFEAAFRGWLKKGAAADVAEDEQEVERALPELAEGQVFTAVTASIREGKTSPPKRYTEDTLLAAMETAGIEDMPEDAERKGLGTPATRAGIIEKLVRTGFVERNKKLLVPTDKGANLIAVLPDEIKSPLLTAEWEQKLKQVERGEITGALFMEGIAALVLGLVAAHTAPLPQYASLFAERPKGDVVGRCPRCGAEVTESAKGFFCSSRACKFALWRDSRFWQAKEKKLDKKIAAALLSEGRVFFSDLKSGRTGKTYAAAVVLEDDGGRVNFKLDFENKDTGRKSA